MREKPKQARLDSGFTVVEILVAAAIVVMLSFLSLIAFASFSKSEALDASASAIASGLRDARAQTLASVGGTQYGIHVESTSYTFFQGLTYNSSDPGNRTSELSSYVRASSTRSSFVFQRITGNAVASGTIEIYLSTDPSERRLIDIAATGLVDIQ